MLERMILNWLVVGIGDITRKRVIPAIQTTPRSALRSVVTRDAKKAEAYPGVKSWATVQDALAGDPGIEACLLYTSSSLPLKTTPQDLLSS